MKALHSLSPEPIDADEDVTGGFTADREPSLPELYSRAVITTSNGCRRWRASRSALRDDSCRPGPAPWAASPAPAAALVPQVKRLLKGDLSALLAKVPPKTRFSGDVSAHRVFEAVGLPLADFKPIRAQVDGATLNDLFLAIVGGALNKYLGEKASCPTRR